MLIEFPSGPALLEAKSKAGKHMDAEHALWKLARFYIDMNHITSSKDVFAEGGRVAHTALEFVGGVCDTIGYHKAGQVLDPQGVA